MKYLEANIAFGLSTLYEKRHFTIDIRPTY